MSGPAFNKRLQRPKTEVAAPWIEAGILTESDIDTLSAGFARTTKALGLGSTIASLASLPVLYKLKAGIIKTAVGSMAAGLMGGLAGATYGAIRMQVDFKSGDKHQTVGKIQLFQALTLHSNDPIAYPLPPLPNGAQSSGSPSTNGFLSSLPPSSAPSTSQSGAEQAFRKPFPMPKYDDRPPPEQYVGFVQDDARANGDDGPSDLGFVPDDAPLGGSRLGSSDMNPLERATHENPTSFSLLRSRATLNTSPASTLPPVSTAPMSSDFSTQSTAPPSISSSSLAPPSISTPSISLDLTPSNDDTDARARDQARFDALVDRQRTPEAGPWDARGVKKGETVW